MAPETSKSRSLLGEPAVRQTWNMPSKTVIKSHGGLQPDGFLGLRLIATRRRQLQFTESGSYPRPSIGARHDGDFYPQKVAVPRGLTDKTTLSSLTL